MAIRPEICLTGKLRAMMWPLSIRDRWMAAARGLIEASLKPIKVPGRVACCNGHLQLFRLTGGAGRRDNGCGLAGDIRLNPALMPRREGLPRGLRVVASTAFTCTQFSGGRFPSCAWLPD
jgi:hypothetical protein